MALVTPIIHRVTDTEAILDHFARLPADDLQLRFMTAATPDLVKRYVDTLGRRGDILLGATQDGVLTGFSHCALRNGTAEIGISLLPEARGTGLASRLFSASISEAAFLGAFRVVISCEMDNAAMIALARRHGMRITSSCGQTDGEIEVAPPDPARRLRWTMERLVDISLAAWRPPAVDAAATAARKRMP